MNFDLSWLTESQIFIYVTKGHIQISLTFTMAFSNLPVPSLTLTLHVHLPFILSLIRLKQRLQQTFKERFVRH